MPSVLAITGQIGNARVVLSREWNGRETIERNILVINPNNVSVDIRLEPSEELSEIVELIDDSFVLEAGEEKRARFNLVIKEPGQWNGRINVFFRPDDGNSVVLASTMIVTIKSENDTVIPPSDDNQGDTITTPDDDNQGDTITTPDDDNQDDGSVGFGIKGAKEEKSNSGIIALVIILIVAIAAIVGFFFYLKK